MKTTTATHAQLDSSIRRSRPWAKNIHLLGGVYGIYLPPIEKSDWRA
jgi:mannitol-specific phosphotransferase system IIBC component